MIVFAFDSHRSYHQRSDSRSSIDRINSTMAENNSLPLIDLTVTKENGSFSGNADSEDKFLSIKFRRTGVKHEWRDAPLLVQANACITPPPRNGLTRSRLQAARRQQGCRYPSLFVDKSKAAICVAELYSTVESSFPVKRRKPRAPRKITTKNVTAVCDSHPTTFRRELSIFFIDNQSFVLKINY